MTLRALLIDLSVMEFIAVVLALMGPFGMFAVPLPIRLLYWLLMGATGYAVYFPVLRWISQNGPTLDLPMPALWAAACLIMSAPMTAVIWFANGLFAPIAPFRIEAAAGLYTNIVIVAGVVCVIFWFQSAPRRAGPDATGRETQPSPSITAPSPFLDRLPSHLGRDLIALEMEDHYVRAHTSQGSALILLRLRDAITELGGVEGAQVHRSWWVARGAVEKVARDGRNVRLDLRGGLMAPVARNAVPELREKGWL